MCHIQRIRTVLDIVTTQSSTVLLTVFQNFIYMLIGNLPFYLMHLNIFSHQFTWIFFIIFKKLCSFPHHCCTAV